MAEKIKRLPYCEDCFLPMTDDERCECMTHWRPQLGTKVGFPTEDGWNCPKDSFTEEQISKLISALHTIECHKRLTQQGDVLLKDNMRY